MFLTERKARVELIARMPTDEPGQEAPSTTRTVRAILRSSEAAANDAPGVVVQR